MNPDAFAAAAADFALAGEMEKAGDARGCLVAAANVRRRFAHMVGAPVAPPDAKLEIRRIFRARAHIDFDVPDGGASILRRFPCHSEAQRIAAWVDRIPSLPAEKRKMATDWLRVAAGLEPEVCFGSSLKLSKALGFDWTRSPAPMTNDCQIEIAAAGALLDVPWLDDKAHRAATEDFKHGITLNQSGDQNACTTTVSGVRQRFARMLGAPETE